LRRNVWQCFFELGALSEYTYWSELPDSLQPFIYKLKDGFLRYFAPVDHLLVAAAICHPGLRKLQWLKPAEIREAQRNFKNEMFDILRSHDQPVEVSSDNDNIPVRTAITTSKKKRTFLDDSDVNFQFFSLGGHAVHHTFRQDESDEPLVDVITNPIHPKTGKEKVDEEFKDYLEAVSYHDFSVLVFIHLFSL
jgi:hypothetical protein